jgi:hypothetical protein
MSDRPSRRSSRAAAAAATSAIASDAAASSEISSNDANEELGMTLHQQEQLMCELETRIAQYETWTAQGINSDQIRRELKMGFLRPIHLTDSRYRDFVVNFIVRAINLFPKQERTFVDTANSPRVLTHIFANQFHDHKDDPNFDLDARTHYANCQNNKCGRLNVTLKPYVNGFMTIDIVTVGFFKDTFLNEHRALWGERVDVAFNLFIDVITHVRSFRQGGRGYKPYHQFPALIEAGFTDQSWRDLVTVRQSLHQAGEESGSGAAGPVHQTELPVMPHASGSAGALSQSAEPTWMPCFSELDSNIWVVVHDPEFEAENPNYWTNLWSTLIMLVRENTCLELAGNIPRPIIRHANNETELLGHVYVEVDCKEIIQIIGPIASTRSSEYFHLTNEQYSSAGALMRTLMSNEDYWSHIVWWYKIGKPSLKNIRESGNERFDSLGAYSASDTRLPFLGSTVFYFNDGPENEDDPFAAFGSPAAPVRSGLGGASVSPYSLVSDRPFARPRGSSAVRSLRMDVGSGSVVSSVSASTAGTAPASAVVSSVSASIIGAATASADSVVSGSALTAAASSSGVEAGAAGTDIGGVMDSLVSGIHLLRDRLSQINSEENQYSREITEAIAKTRKYMARQALETLREDRHTKYRRLQVENYEHKIQLQCTLMIRETQTQKDTLDQQNAVLQAEVERKRAEERQLQQDLDRKRSEIAETERNIQRENEDYQRLLREISEASVTAEAKLGELRDKEQELNASISAKQNEKQILDAQYASKTLQLRELRDGLDELLQIKESNRRKSQEITIKEQALELQRRELEAEKQRLREAVVRLPNDWQTGLTRMVQADSRDPFAMLRSMQAHLQIGVHEDFSVGAGMPGGSTRYARDPGSAAGGGSGSVRGLASASRVASDDGGSGGHPRGAGSDGGSGSARGVGSASRVTSGDGGDGGSGGLPGAAGGGGA